MPGNIGARSNFCAIFALQSQQRQVTNFAQVVSCNILVVSFGTPVALKIVPFNTSVADGFRVRNALKFAHVTYI